MSRPHTLDLPTRSSRIGLDTSRGRFAAIVCEPLADHPEGHKAGTTALLVPGFTGSKEDFIEVLGPLRDSGRRVVAIDQRGQYESPGGDDPADYTVDALAADLLAVIDVIGGPVHLVGHSFGGFVSRVAAGLEAPSRIQSLVLMGSGPGRITSAQQIADLDLLRRALATMGMSELWELKRTLERARGDVDPPDPVAAFLRERFVRTHPRGLLEAAAELDDDIDRLAPLAALRLPVLVMYGVVEDVWAPAELAAMARQIGARESVIGGAGHSPAVDNPDATAHALIEFWRDVEAGSLDSVQGRSQAAASTNARTASATS